MSMRKKPPGHTWITGIQRAQMQKMQRYLNSIPTANGKQPAGKQPMTGAQLIDFSECLTAVQALLALKS